MFDASSSECIYDLFLAYATWFSDGKRAGVLYEDFGRLLIDLDLLVGLREDRYEELLREYLLRYDSDGDGMLSVAEFLTWFFCEVSAIVPIGTHGGVFRGCAPVYNMYVSALSYGAGNDVGGSALQDFQRQQLFKTAGLVGVRGQMHKGRVAVGASRALSPRKTMGVEAGAKLQFAGLSRLLFSLSTSLGMSEDNVLYRVASCGRKPPMLTPSTPKPVAYEAVQAVQACYLGGDGYNIPGNENAKQSHSRDSYNKLRTVFNRYTAAMGSGVKPEPSPRPVWALFGNDVWEDELPPEGGSNAADKDAFERLTNVYPGCCCQYQSLTLMELHTWRAVCNKHVIRMDNKLTPQRIEMAFLVASAVGGPLSEPGSLGMHNKPISTCSQVSVPGDGRVASTRIGPGSVARRSHLSLSAIAMAGSERIVASPALTDEDVCSPCGRPWDRGLGTLRATGTLQGSSPSSPTLAGAPGRASLSDSEDGGGGSGGSRGGTLSASHTPKSGAGGGLLNTLQGSRSGSRGGTLSASHTPRSGTGEGLPGAFRASGSGGGMSEAVRLALPHRSAVPTLNFLQFIEALRLVAVYMAEAGPDTGGMYGSHPRAGSVGIRWLHGGGSHCRRWEIHLARIVSSMCAACDDGQLPLDQPNVPQRPVRSDAPAPSNS